MTGARFALSLGGGHPYGAAALKYPATFGEVIRMRLLASALIALATLTWTASPGEARTREQAQAQSRQAAPQANRASATRTAAAPQRQSAPARQAAPARQGAAGQARTANDARGARQAAARSGGHQQQAAAQCRGRNCAPRSRTVSWQGGLEPPTNAQAQSCPAGTLATLAHGHSDVVRCLPL